MKLKRARRRDSTSVSTETISTDQKVDGGDWNQPRPGECKVGICGREPACIAFPNSTYICICTLDNSKPTTDLKCPSRSAVARQPQPIHNIIPPTPLNKTTVNITTTTEATHKLDNVDGSIDYILIAVPSAITLLILLVTLIICWWKWKSINNFICRSKKSRKTEAPTTGEPLLAERYIANPQYSTAYSVLPNSKGPSVPLINKDSLNFIEEIGEGCFGKVFKGMLKIDANTTTMVAIKVLKDSASRTAEDDFIREVNIMSAFRHENILSLIGIVGDIDINPSMVFEFMPYGDLAGVLRSNTHILRRPIPQLPTLDSKHLLFIALQIACGMKYLAFQRFVHRDLACRNCLVGENFVVKIADFGMSRDIYTCDYYKMGGNRLMPVRWMSPESILYARFTLESDVWSYGVVLWEIYSFGKQPFYGHNNDEVSKLILQGIMLIAPEDCPAFICDLMKACWRSNPKDRIRFHDICDKLQAVYDDGGWDDPKISDNDNKINENDSWISSYDITNKLSLESVNRISLPTIDVPPQELMDPEGYLLPNKPVIGEYMTALPD